MRGKKVGISAGQDNDTLYVGNICKTWSKEHVMFNFEFGVAWLLMFFLEFECIDEFGSHVYSFLMIRGGSSALLLGA